MKHDLIKRTIIQASAVVLLVAASGLSQAVTISPNTTISSIDPKDGLCSLRECFIVTNNNARWGFVPGECPAGSATEPDTILIPAGLYLIGSRNPITGDLNVIGASRGETIIDVKHRDEIFQISNRQSQQPFDVLIQSMTLRNGGFEGTISIGTANVLLLDLEIYGAKGFTSGGILSGSSVPVTTIIKDCWLHDNEGLYGAAVFGGGNTHLIIDSTTISNNYSPAAPAGIGYFARGNSPGLVLVNSTLSNNKSVNDGTAILTDAPNPSMILSSTIVGNVSDASTGGIKNYTAPLNLRNSILAGNSGHNGPSDCASPDEVISDGYNILALDSDCLNVQPTDVLVASWNNGAGVLAAMDANGGPTPTHALLPGSIALDAGEPSGCIGATPEVLTTDQRGSERTVDGNHDGQPRCDIGAYEFVPPDPLVELAALADDVASLKNLRGIVSSLSGKLNAAINAIDDANPHNDAVALGAMQAFINAIEAQRGKKLTDEEADLMVSDALAIIDLLSTQLNIRRGPHRTQ